ncbi:MAG: metal-sensing transcriptional repressor [Ruminococcaceae bacterium]|nr:metal-sensing transcriptional repressor [Oscillospiraceae bacterium]
MDKCACHKTKIREEAEYKALLNRLARIEGQLRGIRGMVENNAYCPDILTQTAAVNAAIDAFSRELLASHIRSCVTEDIRQGKDETVEELLKLLRKMMH